MKVSKIAAGRYSVHLTNGAEWVVVKTEGGRWVAYNENRPSDAWDGMATKGEVMDHFKKLDATLSPVMPSKSVPRAALGPCGK